jgi:hypothetical protein
VLLEKFRYKWTPYIYIQDPMLSYKVEEISLKLYSKFTLSYDGLINTKNAEGLAT